MAKRSLSGQSIIAAAAFASCIWLLVQQVSSSSFTSKIIYVGTRGYGSPLSGMDAELNQWANGHSVLLRFSGFDQTDEQQADFMRTTWRRGNYILFPSRVYSILNDPPEISVTPDWLREHDVRNYVWLVREPDGKVSFKESRISFGSPQSVETQLRSVQP